MDWAEDLKQTFKKVCIFQIRIEWIEMMKTDFRRWKKVAEPLNRQAMWAAIVRRHPTMIWICKKMHCRMNSHRDWILNRYQGKTNKDMDGPMNQYDRVAAESMLIEQHFHWWNALIIDKCLIFFIYRNRNKPSQSEM